MVQYIFMIQRLATTVKDFFLKLKNTWTDVLHDMVGEISNVETLQTKFFIDTFSPKKNIW